MSSDDFDLQLFINDFRAGTYASNVLLGKAHGRSEATVRRLIAKHGLQRDLQPEVKQRVAVKLQRQPSKDQPKPEPAKRSAPMSDDEIIVEATADIIVAVIHDHRAMLGETRKLYTTLHDQLKVAIEQRDEIISDIVDETADDKTLARKMRMLRSVSLHRQIPALRDLTGVLTAVIKLEREAYGVDEQKPEEKDSIESLLDGLV